MPRQAWVFSLGAVALQAWLCVSMTAVSAQHPSNNEAPRSFRVVDINPVTERFDGTEERGPLYPNNIVDNLYMEVVGKTEFDLTVITLPEFNVWYTKVMNRFDHEAASKKIADTCTRLFGLSSYHRALNYAKRTLKDPSMPLALEDAQIQYWLHQKTTNAYALYRMLQLNGDDKTLTDLPWDAWKKYVDIRYPDEDPYGVMIAEGYERDSEKIFYAHFIMKMWMSDIREFAEVAINAMLTNWQQKGLPEQEVYKLLRLEQTDAPLSSALLPLWIFYAQRLGLDTNAKLFSHLQKCYKEKQIW